MHTHTHTPFLLLLVPVFAVFEDMGVDLQRPVIGTCSSAVTGCVVVFSLDQLVIKAAVYDVSQGRVGGGGYR